MDEIVERFLYLVSPLREVLKDMYLFGSRSRNNWRPDSDYDILILLEKRDRKVIDKLYDAVMEVLLSSGRLVSLKIFTVSEFDRLRSLQTPFVNNVLKEGIKIGTHD